MLRSNWPLAALIVFAVFMQTCAPESWGDVYRCEDEQGNVTFTDDGCETMIAETYEIVESSGGLTPIYGDNLSAEDRQRLAQADQARMAGRNRRLAQADKRQAEQVVKDRACTSARKTQEHHRDFRRRGHGGHDDTIVTDQMRQKIRENC